MMICRFLTSCYLAAIWAPLFASEITTPIGPRPDDPGPGDDTPVRPGGGPGISSVQNTGLIVGQGDAAHFIGGAQGTLETIGGALV